MTSLVSLGSLMSSTLTSAAGATKTGSGVGTAVQAKQAEPHGSAGASAAASGTLRQALSFIPEDTDRGGALTTADSRSSMQQPTASAAGTGAGAQPQPQPPSRQQRTVDGSLGEVSELTLEELAGGGPGSASGAGTGNTTLDELAAAPALAALRSPEGDGFLHPQQAQPFRPPVRVVSRSSSAHSQRPAPAATAAPAAAAPAGAVGSAPAPAARVVSRASSVRSTAPTSAASGAFPAVGGSAGTSSAFAAASHVDDMVAALRAELEDAKKRLRQ